MKKLIINNVSVAVVFLYAVVGNVFVGKSDVLANLEFPLRDMEAVCQPIASILKTEANGKDGMSQAEVSFGKYHSADGKMIFFYVINFTNDIANHPPVFFINGGPLVSSYNDFKIYHRDYSKHLERIPELKKMKNVVFFDQRDTGCSSSYELHPNASSEEYMKEINLLTAREIAQDIDSLRINLFGNDSKAHLLGASFGGYITYNYLLLYPENVKSFSTFGSSVMNNSFEWYTLRIKAAISVIDIFIRDFKPNIILNDWKCAPVTNEKFPNICRPESIEAQIYAFVGFKGMWDRLKSTLVERKKMLNEHAQLIRSGYSEDAGNRLIVLEEELKKLDTFYKRHYSSLSSDELFMDAEYVAFANYLWSGGLEDHCVYAYNKIENLSEYAKYLGECSPYPDNMDYIERFDRGLSFLQREFIDNRELIRTIRQHGIPGRIYIGKYDTRVPPKTFEEMRNVFGDHGDDLVLFKEYETGHALPHDSDILKEVIRFIRTSR